MILTDTFIEIGSQHKVCEDYIVSGNDPVPFIILADGCSKSNDSEMGSRILCHLAKQYVRYNGVNPEDIKYADKLGSWVIHNAEMVARQMGLKKSCLDSTLIIGYVVDDIFYAHMFGDGFIITQPTLTRTVLYEISWIEYSKNAPFYLTYQIDDERAEFYHNMKIRKDLNYLYVPNGEGLPTVNPIESSYDLPLTFKYSMKDYNKILICSDGISSFLEPTAGSNSNKLIKVHSLLPELFAFKTTTGQFLKRRCNKYMKSLKKISIEHFDDLSIGAFLYEDDNDGT
jgi:hypothetical protein